MLDFDVPRPKALWATSISAGCRAISTVRSRPRLVPAERRGADSPVFRRLASALQETSGLSHDPEEGGLLLRVRRAGRDWQVLLRLTAKPLSARWRRCSIEGGLNACIAAAMNRAHPGQLTGVTT